MVYKTNKINKDKKEIEKMIETEIVVPELENAETPPIIPLCKNTNIT